MSRRIQNILVILIALTAAVMVVKTQTNWLDNAPNAECDTAHEAKGLCHHPLDKKAATP
ncbi:MAG: hypothetical protein K2X09_05515 [Rickettsiales bacterium]|nr:hypothetical protein [Rickettsiales bacterium]